MKNKNVVLIGFMGAGKSLISNKLANMLNLDVISTDAIIKKQEGREIARIFEESGEAYFRELERKTVVNIKDRKNTIIDCGGGVVINPDNVADLKKNGLLIYLKASAETIYKRIKGHKHRPLLNVTSPKQSIEDLLTKREPFYSQADYVIETDEKTLNEICDEILRIINDE